MRTAGKTILVGVESFAEYGLDPWSVVICDCLRVHEVTSEVRLLWCECGRRLLVQRG